MQLIWLLFALTALPQATSYFFSVIVALWWWKIPSPAKFGDLTRHRHLHKTGVFAKEIDCCFIRSSLDPAMRALYDNDVLDAAVPLELRRMPDRYIRFHNGRSRVVWFIDTYRYLHGWRPGITHVAELLSLTKVIRSLMIMHFHSSKHLLGNL